MLDSQVLAFTAVAALLTVTPGSDTMLVIRNTLRGGRGYGWMTMAGILAGLLDVIWGMCFSSSILFRT